MNLIRFSCQVLSAGCLSIILIPMANEKVDALLGHQPPTDKEIPERKVQKTPLKKGDNLSGFPVTSHFMPCEKPDRSDCRNFGSGRHRGIDLATPTGTVITAPSSGRSYCGFQGEKPTGTGWGEYVAWAPDDGDYIYLFGHLSACYTEATPPQRAFARTGGAPGSKGAGTSTGPHAHVEKIKKDGEKDVWELVSTGERQLLYQEEREYLEKFFSRQW